MVELVEELQTAQSKAEKSAAIIEQEHEAELAKKDVMSESLLRGKEREHEATTTSLQSKQYQQSRATTKHVVALETERDKALSGLAFVLANQAMTVKEATKSAKEEERHHYTPLLYQQKKTTSSLAASLHAKTDENQSMTDAVISAERRARTTERESNTSSRRARENLNSVIHLKEQLRQATLQNTTLEAAVGHLQAELEKTTMALVSLRDAVPIKVIERERRGKHGSKSWPLYIWELILEQLVSGTPLTSVNDNIVAHVKKFSPTTKINELPSIWTIRRARTVLLVVVQTLATYRIAKADRWGQLFSDETMRRQVSFQNLIISVEEDELYK